MDAKLENVVKQWLQLDADPQSRAKVEELGRTDAKALKKSMIPRISFGTAGLRAEMGPGFAYMNSITVTQASQGLAKYVEVEVVDAKNRGIVIGHDHRHHSLEFAHDVARTFAYAGFKIHFLAQVHTPMVPFAISQLRAACGVMITASHNPAKDNGYKVYWENACQIISPHDTGIAKQIDANLELWDAPLPKLNRIDLLDEYFKVAIQPLTAPSRAPTSTIPQIVYTPMHGVGTGPALKCFELLGLRDHVRVVREQAEPDPDFPTVKFPNPEEKGALDLAKAEADKVGARIVLANDPDADRFTCAVREPASETDNSKVTWTQLTGDEIGSLFTNYILSSARPERGRPVAVINSTVSSRQMQRITERASTDEFPCEYFETLTGFKWIGNKAIDLEKNGYRVLFAYEEAIGYMAGGHAIKDKDGISALFVFTQLLLDIYARHSSVHAELEQLSESVGYFATHNSYYTVASPSVTVDTFKKIRTLPKTHIGDLQVTAWRDLTEGYDSTQPDKKPVLPVSKSSEMLTVEVSLVSGEHARFTARGSGTEPKLKVYIEASAQSAAKAQNAADYVWDTLAAEWFKNLNAAK